MKASTVLQTITNHYHQSANTENVMNRDINSDLETKKMMKWMLVLCFRPLPTTTIKMLTLSKPSRITLF